MNKEIQKNDDNDQIQKPEYSDAVNKISLKSNNIKAMLKFKYILYKLERSFYHNKFML